MFARKPKFFDFYMAKIIWRLCFQTKLKEEKLCITERTLERYCFIVAVVLSICLGCCSSSIVGHMPCMYETLSLILHTKEKTRCLINDMLSFLWVCFSAVVHIRSLYLPTSLLKF